VSLAGVLSRRMELVIRLSRKRAFTLPSTQRGVWWMGALGDFSAEEKRALMQGGFLTADDRVDRQAVAQGIFEFMRKRHTSRAIAVSNRALALHVVRITNPTPRLMQLISSLMNTTGPVQKIINGAGSVLLRIRGDEKFESREGVGFTRNVSLRWISTDDEEIWTHGVEADLDTYKRKADRSREFFAIVEERRPALAARLSEVKALARGKIEEGLTRALPKPRRTGA
jgi:hypothetical protein